MAIRIKPHPGEILDEEYMTPLGISARELASALGVPANRISEILRGRRGVTADTAARLGRYFGTSAEMWLNMQQAHDLSKVRAERGDEIAAVRPRAA